MPRRSRTTRTGAALVAAGVALVSALASGACAGATADGPPAASTTRPATSATLAPRAATAAAAKVTPPPVNARFDYQLGGAYTPPPGTATVVRDRTAKPVPGRYNICYVNAFQTQPGEATFWTTKHPDLVLRHGNGTPVTDPDWPDEYVLDTSTPAKRAAIAKIEYAWIDGCAKAGFRAVDPDNLDTWTRWPDRLTVEGNLALAKLLADRAHAKGLAIAQKNAAELRGLGRARAGFDFAVVESCQVYDECGVYTKAYGWNVLEIEYTDTGRASFTRACTARGDVVSVIYRDRDLVKKGQKPYHYESC